MKRLLSLCLIFALLVTTIPVEGFSNPSYSAIYSVTEKEFPNFSRLSENVNVNKWDYASKTYKAVKVNLKQLVHDAKLSGKKLENVRGMYLCPMVLAEYDLVAYNVDGTYLSTRGFNDPTYNKDANGFRQWEYEYLGYDYAGKAMTNDLHLNDTGYADPNKLLNKNWTKNDRTLDSWKEDISTAAADNIFKTPFVSDDGTGTRNPLNFSLQTILNPTLLRNHGFSYGSAGDLTIDQLNTAKEYPRVHAFPSIATKGSAVLIHKTQNGSYYNTFIIDELELKFKPTMTITAFLDANCTQPITCYKFGEVENTKNIFVKIKTDINMASIGYGGKEADFIKSVTNKFMNNETVNKNVITSSTNMSNVSNVYPFTIKRGDEKRVFKAVTTIEPRTDIADITKLIRAETTLNISAEDPPPIVKIVVDGEINPDFGIYRELESEPITDKSFEYKTDTGAILKDLNFQLKDKTLVGTNMSIAKYNWEVFNHQTRQYTPFSLDKDPYFLLKKDEQIKYLNADNEIYFNLQVTSKTGIKRFANHKTKIVIVKPEPEDPDDEDEPETPKKFSLQLSAPSQIKAGEVGELTAMPYIVGGVVDQIIYNLSDATKTVSSMGLSRNVTFLDYENDMTNEVVVSTDFGWERTAGAVTKGLHPLEGTYRAKGNQKVNRTITIDSEGSTGTLYYPIDKVTWHIKPLEGQSEGSIKFHTSKVGEKIDVDFKQEGLYELNMEIHSTCTFPNQEFRTASKLIKGQIRIYPDLPPVAKVSVPTKVLRDPTNYRRAIYKVCDLSYSTDGDDIGNKRFYARRDTDNDKSLEDETWELIYEGLNDAVDCQNPLVGLYEYRIEVDETHESVTSKFFNPASDTRRDNTDSQPIEEKKTAILNVAPITSAMADKRTVDILIATDCEGAKMSALKSEADMLVKDLYEIGVNAKVKFLFAKKKIGYTLEPINKYVRYFRYSYNVEDQYTNWDGSIGRNVRTVSQTIPWETRYQLHSAYLPNYGSIPVYFSKEIVKEPLNKPGSSIYYPGDDPYNYKDKYNITIPADPYNKWYTVEAYTRQTFFTTTSYATVFNFQTSVDGTFRNEGATGFQQQDMYGIDLDQVKAQTFRAGADRKLILAPESTSSVLNLDGAFKDWVIANKLEVSTTGVTDVLDNATKNWQRVLSPSTVNPMSLNDIISTTTKGKSFTNLEAFKASINAEYSQLQYQARITRLLNDVVNLQVLYADYENDPIAEASIGVTHDPYALENNIGLDANHGTNTQTLTGYALSKTGLYTLKPKVKDNPNEDDRFSDFRLWNRDKMTYEILVHRKPIAVPKLVLVGTANQNVFTLKAVDNGSYDIDHQSEAQKGITAVEWAFKAKDSTDWNYVIGTLGTVMNRSLNFREKYYVSYRVKDKEGEWSDPVTQDVEAIPQLYLDAKLKPKTTGQSLDKLSVGSTVTLHDVWTSYQLPHLVRVQLYDGNTPVLSNVLLTKTAQNVSSEDPPEVFWKDIDFLIPKGAGLQEKTYRLRISATDNADGSVTKFKDFNISLVNNTAPTIKVVKMTPQTLLESDDLLLSVLPEDADNDRLTLTVNGSFLKASNGKNKQKEGLTPIQQTNLISGKVIDLNAYKNLNAGNYELNFEVVDPQGAKGHTTLNFTVGDFSISDIQVTGSWNHWRGQKDLFGEHLENHKGRFLSYERVRIDVKTLGEPECVEVRMSPELESMVFHSESGKVYRYKDALGYEVKFPLALKPNNGLMTATYVLPLAPSTVTTKGLRVRQSYWLDVTIYKLGRSKTKRYGGNNALEGIEITGNVYDHVYQQPVKK